MKQRKCDIQFEPAKNATTFKDSDPELIWNIVRKLPVAPNKFNNNLTKQHYIGREENYQNFELCHAMLETIKNILSSLHTSKASGLIGMPSWITLWSIMM